MVVAEDLFGKRFTAFELRGSLIGRENAQAPRLEQVGNAERERQLRADDGEIDIFFDRERGELLDLLNADGDKLGEFANAGAARRAVNFRYARALANFPNQGVLASAAANDQDFHERLTSLPLRVENGRSRMAILDCRSSILD
jgi:hypothetical protein